MNLKGTGKTSLTKTSLTIKLSNCRNTNFVPEIAKVFLGNKHIEYEDIF